MKKIVLFTALLLPAGLYAQGPNTGANPQVQATNNVLDVNFFDNVSNADVNAEENNFSIEQQAQQAPDNRGNGLGSLFGTNKDNAPCTDCDQVKQAVKTARVSSGSSGQKKSFSMKRWSKKVSGRAHLKMKKIFSGRHKVKTSYALCFNWH